MNYANGEQICVGDRVKIDGEDIGTVVVDIDRKEGLDGFDAADWAYLGHGVMVLTDGKALVRISRAVNSRGSTMIEKTIK